MKNLYSRIKNKLVCADCDLLKERNIKYPDALILDDRILSNCKVVAHRDKLLDVSPKKAVCAEIGIQTGKTSKKILEKTEPVKLHLIEIQDKWVQSARRMFADEIANNIVSIHHGASYDELLKFEDNYFDWVYIDGDHRYDGVKRDLEVARLKTKDDGLIWLHDYIFYGHISHQKIGVVEAVNEMCMQYDYEIVYFALHQQMYNSVVLKKLIA